jgi:hypothetical protein
MSKKISVWNAIVGINFCSKHVYFPLNRISRWSMFIRREIFVWRQNTVQYNISRYIYQYINIKYHVTKRLPVIMKIHSRPSEFWTFYWSWCSLSIAAKLIALHKHCVDSKYIFHRHRHRSFHCYMSLHSNAELFVRQSPASKDVNKEAEEATSLELAIAL